MSVVANFLIPLHKKVLAEFARIKPQFDAELKKELRQLKRKLKVLQAKLQAIPQPTKDEFNALHAQLATLNKQLTEANKPKQRLREKEKLPQDAIDKISLLNSQIKTLDEKLNAPQLKELASTQASVEELETTIATLKQKITAGLKARDITYLLMLGALHKNNKDLISRLPQTFVNKLNAYRKQLITYSFLKKYQNFIESPDQDKFSTGKESTTSLYFFAYLMKNNCMHKRTNNTLLLLLSSVGESAQNESNHFTNIFKTTKQQNNEPLTEEDKEAIIEQFQAASSRENVLQNFHLLLKQHAPDTAKKFKQLFSSPQDLLTNLPAECNGLSVEEMRSQAVHYLHNECLNHLYVAFVSSAANPKHDQIILQTLYLHKQFIINLNQKDKSWAIKIDELLPEPIEQSKFTTQIKEHGEIFKQIQDHITLQTLYMHKQFIKTLNQKDEAWSIKIDKFLPEPMDPSKFTTQITEHQDTLNRIKEIFSPNLNGFNLGEIKRLDLRLFKYKAIAELTQFPDVLTQAAGAKIGDITPQQINNILKTLYLHKKFILNLKSKNKEWAKKIKALLSERAVFFSSINQEAFLSQYGIILKEINKLPWVTKATKRRAGNQIAPALNLLQLMNAQLIKNNEAKPVRKIKGSQLIVSIEQSIIMAKPNFKYAQKIFNILHKLNKVNKPYAYSFIKRNQEKLLKLLEVLQANNCPEKKLISNIRLMLKAQIKTEHHKKLYAILPKKKPTLFMREPLKTAIYTEQLQNIEQFFDLNNQEVSRNKDTLATQFGNFTFSNKKHSSGKIKASATLGALPDLIARLKTKAAIRITRDNKPEQVVATLELLAAHCSNKSIIIDYDLAKLQKATWHNKALHNALHKFIAHNPKASTVRLISRSKDNKTSYHFSIYPPAPRNRHERSS